jgi:eukaryotic-like serine/threonine-protein kinase
LAAVSQPLRVVGGRYALLRELGRGAMGVVWLARDDVLRREVAIKQVLLPPGLDTDAERDVLARAMREGRIAARLHNPNAVAVFDAVTEDGTPWLVMEYVRSVSLAEATKNEPLAPLEAARIGARVARALAAAHALGIVHRDVKPGNVLLGDEDTVKITDFGISRAADDVTVTRTGMLSGTPAYLAPEVAAGGPAEPPADVFSLGATLYASVEGRPPFGLADNPLAMLHRVAGGSYDPPRRAGPLTGVLGWLLAREPAARPTAAQAAGLLSQVEQGEQAAGLGTTTRPISGAAASPTGTLPEYTPAGPATPESTSPVSIPTGHPPGTDPLDTVPRGDDQRERGRARRWVMLVAALLVVAAFTVVAAVALNGRDVTGNPTVGDTSVQPQPAPTIGPLTTTTVAPRTTTMTPPPTTTTVPPTTTTTMPPTTTTTTTTVAPTTPQTTASSQNSQPPTT